MPVASTLPGCGCPSIIERYGDLEELFSIDETIFLRNLAAFLLKYGYGGNFETKK